MQTTYSSPSAQVWTFDFYTVVETSNAHDNRFLDFNFFD